MPQRESLTRKAEQLAGYRFGLRVAERGVVASVGDGIAWIKGLPSAAMDDILQFEDGSWAVVYDLTATQIGAILLHQSKGMTAGTPVQRSRQSLSIPVGDALLGRVVDPIGQPLDGAGAIEATERRPLDILAPPIIAREFVHQPLYTGLRSIDSLIPIGKGQRQLIIGDEGTGRSAIAVDTVINQRGRDVLCIYVLIGQKRSTVVNVLETLRAHQAMAYTTIVVGEAGALPGLKYLAPFAGCAIAEAWMAQGRDTLVVYDDLSTHARTYRELSLLLRRPPGREAYPGDIFYLHSRLLERATSLGQAYGGGSMTALPIVETMQGEISAYIPTNLISITDGQIYLDADLFAAGFRPAVDIRRSVSRIGGRAQHPRIKDEAGRMKLDYLQFLELEVFTRFGAKLEAGMEAKIRRGRTLRELLKQERLVPLSPELQLAWLIAFNESLFDEVPLAQVGPTLQGLVEGFSKRLIGIDDPRGVWVDSLKRWFETRSTRNHVPTA